MNGKPNYGSWVSSRPIYVFGAIGVMFLALSFLSLFSAVPATLFLLAAAYFAYARYELSPQGGNLQDRIWQLVIEHLDWNGEGQALDIGCGNGPLAIKLARKFNNARVIGVDSWGRKWKYSKNTCEANAKMEGVAERVTFQKASAKSLPFDDEHFDAVVSNLAFHEVADTPDKRELIREALRVVKKGGKFTFQDHFLAKRLYGELDDLMVTIKSWGVYRVEFVETRKAEFIPLALKLPFVVEPMSIITGEK